jgi:hypothetical protein
MRTVRHLTPLFLLVALAAPATAYGGGWATVELDGQPTGIRAGEPWRAELLVKQHGVTPVDGLTPRVRIKNGEGVVRTFRARPAGRAGTYVVSVTYPSAGTWRTRIFDGFNDGVPHRLAPLKVPESGGAVFARTPKRSANDASPAAPTDSAVVGATTDDPVAATPADDGFPWPQSVAIAFVVLLFAGVWVVTAGPRRRRRREAAAPQQYLPSS